MTSKEKNAIRDMPCSKCGEAPPFVDGNRCDVHRIVPELGYVPGNVVPRCPPCHAAEPGHKPFIAACPLEARSRGGRNQPREAKSRGGRTAGLVNIHKITRGIRVRTVKQQHANRTPEERRELAKRARAAQSHETNVRRGSIAIKSMPREAMVRGGQIGGKIGAYLQPREAKSRGGVTQTHNRWHVARGIMNPKCERCREEAA